jgi:DAK2 domain fusion protein YloV
LPILKQAGVVDSGGEGLRVVLEGILLHFRGEPVGSGSVPIRTRVDFSSLHTEQDDSYGYCTEVLFRGEAIERDSLRERLGALGTSVLVVGDSELMKVHVHTLRPGAVLDLATELGELVRVKVDNMQLQQREFAAAASGGGAASAGTRVRPAGTSVVAVAQGTGFEDLFTSYGAEVVRVELTMNPSVEDIIRAVDATERTEVVVLPNDRNALLAAQQAADQRPDRVIQILATPSMPAGLAATLAVAPDSPAEVNLAAMRQAADRCHCVELTRAVRSARLHGIDIQDGEPLALLDGKPVAAGAPFERLLAVALDRLPQPPSEIVTLYRGSETSEAAADTLATVVRDRVAVDVEVAFGGQPNYDFIVSLE